MAEKDKNSLKFTRMPSSLAGSLLILNQGKSRVQYVAPEDPIEEHAKGLYARSLGYNGGTRNFKLIAEDCSPFPLPAKMNLINNN